MAPPVAVVASEKEKRIGIGIEIAILLVDVNEKQRTATDLAMIPGTKIEIGKRNAFVEIKIAAMSAVKDEVIENPIIAVLATHLKSGAATEIVVDQST